MSTVTSLHSPFSFTLPPELVAKEPPERRGISRDAVRLMVIDRSSDYRINHTFFYDIDKFLVPGDLMVFNTSRTLPASLVGYGKSRGHLVEVHLAEHLPDDSFMASASALSTGQGSIFMWYS
jgi:S-adenosylmethionine:tRNA ribosyltransferase-isomerase